jgi:hypothetical protein
MTTICKEFNDKLNDLGISCGKCLDTGLLWKVRDDINYNDIYKNVYDLEYFIIIECNKCNNNNNIFYSKTSNITYNDIPLFNEKDENYIIRLPTLRRLCENRIIKTEIFDICL